MPTDMVLNQKPDVYSTPIKWDYTGLAVIDLWQLMEYFNAHDFAKCLQEVYTYEMELKRHCEEAGDWNKPVVSGWEDKETNKLLDRVKESFPRKDFPHTSSVSIRVSAFANSQCTYQELWMRIVALRETMEDELKSRKMILVPGLKSDYCDKQDAFGERVALKFPSAKRDIVEAGNCYALGLNAACVFHLMRVLEIGLRALVVDIGLTFKTEAWGRVLEQIETKIQEIRSSDKKDPRKQHLQLYSQCAIEFGYFKDAWRNHVVHETIPFDEHRAKSVMDHVENFMRSVSDWLSEQPKPLTTTSGGSIIQP
jgi:HEPN domain-containing protein